MTRVLKTFWGRLWLIKVSMNMTMDQEVEPWEGFLYQVVSRRLGREGQWQSADYGRRRSQVCDRMTMWPRRRSAMWTKTTAQSSLGGARALLRCQSLLNSAAGHWNWLCDHERKLLIGPEHTFLRRDPLYLTSVCTEQIQKGLQAIWSWAGEL